MRINADFSAFAAVRPSDYEWVESPASGVARVMLDRIGDEVARATSIVRYAPNSCFPQHEHGGGEEFLVLEGEFADEHGSYPAGTYVRNPIGTRHSPAVGPDGAVIFVKLRQFEAGDRRQIAIDTRAGNWIDDDVRGSRKLILHSFGNEEVEMYRLDPDVVYRQHIHDGGEEYFVVEGSMIEDGELYPAGSWLRFPDGSSHRPVAGPGGALLFYKGGHLPSE